ncbi:hypothetical protein [Amycolatopsis sp. Poz14]|uniref:hypothetical protein n=1 Tax=Amycolatopsis sp. Poz14 TaxID=1447705 RepID=UPI001EE8780E|nr:hypothetical protein [Amycolatopsis sp. Poz14]MCG3756674.1 hypothetical protein [Amycolatopsis sp. Poz14]
MSGRAAVMPVWTVTTDGLRHLVVQVLRHTDGTIVKAMCRRWLIPAPPIGDAPACPECAEHDGPEEPGRSSRAQ